MLQNTHKPAAPYVYGLDIARFLCALMVSIFHLRWSMPNPEVYLPFGWVGVQVFFVISGVVIANSAANSTPSQFVKGRFLRLYPAAWIAAIVNLAFLVITPLESYKAMGITVDFSFKTLLGSLTLVTGSCFASAYWTLPIELAFYALVFACLFRGGADSFRLIARALIGVSLPYLVLLFLAYAGHGSLEWLDPGLGRKNMLLLRHGPFFAIGIYYWLITSRRALARIDYVLLAAGFCGCALEIYARAGQLTPHDPAVAFNPGVIALAVSALVVFLLFAGFIFLSLRHAGSWIPPGRLKTWLRTLGLVTYPYYLIHEVMGGSVLRFCINAGLGRQTSLAVTLIAVGVVACLIARHGEPMLRRAASKSIGWAASLGSAPRGA